MRASLPQACVTEAQEIRGLTSSCEGGRSIAATGRMRSLPCHRKPPAGRMRSWKRDMSSSCKMDARVGEKLSWLDDRSLEQSG
jgi:hypothetical protein